MRTEQDYTDRSTALIRRLNTSILELREQRAATDQKLAAAKKALLGISRHCGFCPEHLGADDYKDPGVVMAKEIISAMSDEASKALAAMGDGG